MMAAIKGCAASGASRSIALKLLMQTIDLFFFEGINASFD